MPSQSRLINMAESADERVARYRKLLDEAADRMGAVRRERDEAVELLKRWQYDDTISGGPVEDTHEYLHRVFYAPQWEDA
jgi:hypothetical protein